MIQGRVIQEELAALNSLKELAQSYEEIAVLRMQKIRDSVIKTRDFLSDLSDVFVDLKASYQREVGDILTQRKKGGRALPPLLHKTGKTLLVYLSSNGRLYGSVTQKTYKLFIQDLKKDLYKNSDLLVIGKAGKVMLENSGLGKPFEYFEIPDTSVDIEHIRQLTKKFLQYEKVYVYYGKFTNVVSQSPISTSITGEDIFETEVAAPTPRADRFIFEPTLEKIFYFFETQIMANLFSQTLLENQLARHASRVDAMEEALIHIEGENIRLNRERTKFRHSQQSRKQLETISGIVLWEI
jgi:ATP synthase F1 gamma subunit